MIIAVIPARSGSKRIKDKNIKNFLGRPIISYTIKKLIDSRIFDRVYVSTNNKKIANLSTKFGAEVPFLRSKKLGGDNVSTVDVISEFLLKLNIPIIKVKVVCCVYPCTPLMETKDIKKGIHLFLKQKKSFVYPVLKYKHPVQRSFTITNTGKVKYFLPKFEHYKTQDLKQTYHDAGQFYISNPTNWIKKKKMHSDSTCFEINNFNAVDIDDEDDWKMAEFIYKYKLKF